MLLATITPSDSLLGDRGPEWSKSMLEPHNASHNEGREKLMMQLFQIKFQNRESFQANHPRWWQVAATSSCQRGIDAHCACDKKRLPTSNACLGRQDSGCAVLPKNEARPGGQAARPTSRYVNPSLRQKDKLRRLSDGFLNFLS